MMKRLLKILQKNRDFTFPIFTVGGWLAWEDVYIRSDWRIQKSVLTTFISKKEGLFRLIDDKYRLKASGTIKHCKTALNKKFKEKKYDKVAVLIHGVLCHRLYMSKIEKALKKQGYTVFNFGYASNAYDIKHHGTVIKSFIKTIKYNEINFVTFSMGGLIVRQFINKMPKVKRLVMIAPPNKGSDMADIFENSKIINAVFGPGLKQMKTSAESLASKSEVPKCEFGVIGGKLKKHKSWWRPTRIIYAIWHKKDNDGLVGVEQTKLKKMKDFILLPYDHAIIPFKKRTIHQVLHFLKSGKFEH